MLEVESASTSSLREHRIVDYRTFLQRIAEFQSHRFHRQQKVGENDRRVNIQRFHRLQGDRGGQIGTLADFKQRVAGANIPVRFHVSASLPHEPNRPNIGRPAPASVEKTTSHWSHTHG